MGRDRYLLVGLNTASIIVWLVVASFFPIPIFFLWPVFGILMLVHAVEGYYCESAAYLKTCMPSSDACAMLRFLSRAQPRIVWRVGKEHSRCAKITSWKDTSSPQPPISDLAAGPGVAG